MSRSARVGRETSVGSELTRDGAREFAAINAVIPEHMRASYTGKTRVVGKTDVWRGAITWGTVLDREHRVGIARSRNQARDWSSARRRESVKDGQGGQEYQGGALALFARQSAGAASRGARSGRGRIPRSSPTAIRWERGLGARSNPRGVAMVLPERRIGTEISGETRDSLSMACTSARERPSTAVARTEERCDTVIVSC
jgi:hypothetical protein